MGRDQLCHPAHSCLSLPAPKLTQRSRPIPNTAVTSIQTTLISTAPTVATDQLALERCRTACAGNAGINITQINHKLISPQPPTPLRPDPFPAQRLTALLDAT